MSIVREHDAQCPVCGTKQLVNYYESLNTEVTNDARKILFDESLNNFTCSKCRQTIIMGVDILYHDPRGKYMIYVFHEEPSISHNKLKQLQIVTKMMAGYRYRIVHSYRALSSRVKVFDNGLDDRVVETLKMLVMRNSGNDFIPGSEIYYWGLENVDGMKAMVFVIFKPDGTKVPLIIPFDEHYKDISSRMDKVLDNEDIEDKWLDITPEYLLDLAKSIRS